MRSGKQGERRRKKLVGREREREREDGRRDRRGAGNDGVVREYGERKKKAELLKTSKSHSEKRETQMNSFSVICQINGETN